eukprot:CAMPEP_0117014900 /NCGR_PEP_ID=MMETSP0472-20121206/12002_1 /TAXON_ID=693140 ORGANISM="Tiarina fusus, Strain LIS" /NCGR_SAMPLE_ID=MMETSP0472 /ASSEMBLY_ACC=CAM_ASM_000603 /LENGTH=797 /DNA_ID=CAMNT_0004718575 /DNA_START=76 /DNA_END=2469 /DNA_ORIENTATION=+
MKFTSLFSAALLIGSAYGAASPTRSSARSNAMQKEIRERRKLNHQFMEAMHGNAAVSKGHRKGRSERERREKLHENLLGAARKLQDGQYYQGADGQYYANGQYNGQYAANGQYNNNYQYMNEQFNYAMDIDFNMAARSFKYAGCAAIKSYDEELAGGNADPMTIDTYAVFRLCPAEKCNKYSMTGCGKDYGEYVVEMKTYLGYILEYYDERYQDYCEYCLPCDYEYQLEAKEALQDCYEEMNEQEWQENQQAQQEAWEAYYAANYGDMDGYNAGGNQANGQAYNGGNGFQGYNQYYNSNYQGQGGQGANYNNARNGNGYSWNGNSATSNNMNNGSNRYSGNNDAGTYYNGAGGNSASTGYSYGNNGGGNNGYNGGNRKLAYDGYYNNNNANNANNGNNANNANGNYGNYGNYGQNGNQYNQEANQGGQNRYGYYDEDGAWNEGQADQQNQAQMQGYGFWGADGVWYEYDQQYETQMVECDDGSMCDECEFENEQIYKACDDYICGDYYTYCTDQYYGEVQAFDVFEFLECSPYQSSNGDQFYIGPHCGDNHFTISLGVFSDENCANYIGETITLSQVLGYRYDDDDLFKIPRECISCDGGEDAQTADQYNNHDQYMQNYQEQQQETQGQSRYGDGYYVRAPDTDDEGVVAMCSSLYQNSAPCNKHMEDYEFLAMFMTEEEKLYEERYCTFIENIVFGAYDEQGEILLKREQFDFEDWRNPDQYRKLRLPASQAIGLAVSIILCVTLLAAAVFTKRSITRQSTPWKPKRSLDPSSLSRQNSGIVMGRSRSGPGSAPLI